MTSSATEALRIARETRGNMLSESITVSSALRACWTICTLLRREAEFEWIGLELNGYTKFETFSELENVLPEYRKARILYFDAFNRPLRVTEKLSMIEEYPLSQSVAELEECVEEGLFIYGGPTINAIIEHLKFPVYKGLVSPVTIRKVLNAVGNKVLDFVNSTTLALEYTEIQSGIFEEAREYVDKKLTFSRRTLEKLVATYHALPRAETPLAYSQVAFACREILQDFTDAIFKPKYVRKGEAQPTHEQTKIKLKLALRERLAEGKVRETNVALARIEYLNTYFDELTSYIQKQVHPKDFEPTADDAKRCVIYTYLIIWDVIQLLGSD